MQESKNRPVQFIVDISWVWVYRHSFQCCGSGMCMLDPGFEFFHPGSRVKKIPDPDPHKGIQVFLTQYLFLMIWDHILDPGSELFSIPAPKSGSLIQGSKMHRIIDPDPDAQETAENP